MKKKINLKPNAKSKRRSLKVILSNVKTKIEAQPFYDDLIWDYPLSEIFKINSEYVKIKKFK